MTNIFLLLIIPALLGISGCATTGYATGGRNEIEYEKFHDSYGDQKIVSRNNDLYVEDLDGKNSRRITHTPSVKERYATFSKDMNYIVYTEDYGSFDKRRHYLIKADSDDSERREISFDELFEFSKGRGYKKF